MAHLSLVAAGEKEHSHAQDVIWRQFERVWRVSLRMQRTFAPSVTAGRGQTWDLRYLLSQPTAFARVGCLQAAQRAVDVEIRHELIWYDSGMIQSKM